MIYFALHSGTSLNYIGLKTFSINILDDEVVKNALLDRLSLLKFSKKSWFIFYYIL